MTLSVALSVLVRENGVLANKKKIALKSFRQKALQFVRKRMKSRGKKKRTDVAAPKPKDWADAAALSVLLNLRDRDGVGDALGMVLDRDRTEIIDTVATIIREAAPRRLKRVHPDGTHHADGTPTPRER